MSDYPGYSREKPGWTQRIPRGMRKCNALYKVWHSTIPNFNVYVGNVGYVSSVGITVSYTHLTLPTKRIV